jgi:hypothetical protein
VGDDAIRTVAGAAPMLPLFARTTDGHLRAYEPKAGGGVQPAVDLGTGCSTATALFRLPISGSGGAQDLCIRMNNALTRVQAGTANGSDAELLTAAGPEFFKDPEPPLAVGFDKDRAYASAKFDELYDRRFEWEIEWERSLDVIEPPPYNPTGSGPWICRWPLGHSTR